MHFSLSIDDSWDFARLSGDFNPLHLDPISARRLQFGGTVCHGIHQLLKALELAVEAGHVAPARIESIAVVFGASLRSGVVADVAFNSESARARARVSVTVDGRPLFVAKLTMADGLFPGDRPAAAEPEEPREPKCPVLSRSEDVIELAGTVPLQWNQALARKIFPALAGSAHGPELMVDLLATTRIVGMECPGLNSIYSELKLQRMELRGRSHAAPPGVPHSMSFSVGKWDARFRSVQVGVEGGTFGGTLNAFFRAPSVAQVALAELLPLIPEDRFAGQHALVVGGSRGLGELVAKILVAGGAQVTLTYANGLLDAERVLREVRSAGRDASLLQLDASVPMCARDRSILVESDITHLYYFATPKIAKSQGGKWRSALFDDYCRVYLHGFAELVQSIVMTETRTAPLVVLYPSTVFLNDPPNGFAEYCAAKAAGEAACEHLAKDDRIRIQIPRLPRLRTDQNSSLLGVEGDEPLPVMLEMLRTLHPEGGVATVVDK